MNLEQLRAHKAHLKKMHEDTMGAINVQIAEAMKKRKVTCAACNFRGTIDDWIFVQTFACTSHTNFLLDVWDKLPTAQCLVVCPVCNTSMLVAEHLYHMEFTETINEEGILPEAVFAKVFVKYGDQAMEPMEIDSD
jgi:hypothetical protein